ncbi:MAG: nucleotide sugar dehydrogenase [Phycisphaerales bacterium]
MSILELARARLASPDALVGVVGLGYVGLPLAAAFHASGCRVLGFDTDHAKIEALTEGRNYLPHLGDTMTRSMASSGRFAATGDASRLGEADAVLICVPTPLGPHQEPDLSFVLNSARDIGRALRAGQLIVLESTTYPGTTRDELLPAMLASRPPGSPPLVCGRDFFVAFSPEREDPGRATHTTRTTPKLVGGLDPASAELATLLYRRAVERVVTVSSAEVAEAAKILENVFRAVNIALVNEMKQILTPMGIDVWEVIEAAATKPFGFMPFHPGPGWGGHCIPIDPYYLTWKAREVGTPTRFIELAGEINTAMPHYVVERVVGALNDDGKPLKGSRVLVIGVAYKRDVGDMRETPAAEVIALLTERGAQVSYHDPHVPVFPRMRRHNIELRSVDLADATVSGADCVVVVTDHSVIDWSRIAGLARLVVDTRNAMKGLGGRGARIVKA